MLLAAACVLPINQAASETTRSRHTPPNADTQLGIANSFVRPGAANDVPHLTEIYWDDGDLRSLLTIRFMPQKTSFAAGWTDWASQTILREEGFPPTKQPSAWPHSLWPMPTGRRMVVWVCCRATCANSRIGAITRRGSAAGHCSFDPLSGTGSKFGPKCCPCPGIWTAAGRAARQPARAKNRLLHYDLFRLGA
jgi:hypothetical protein